MKQEDGRQPITLLGELRFGAKCGAVFGLAMGFFGATPFSNSEAAQPAATQAIAWLASSGIWAAIGASVALISYIRNRPHNKK